MTATVLRDVFLCEQRLDQAYDNQTASTVHVWRGTTLTLAASFDRATVVAMTRQVIQ